jgi:Antibiotic biosynthesis monooxygenase
VLVVTRYVVPPAEGSAFLARAQVALAALAARPGWRSGRIGRATDDSAAWVLTTEWDSVGAYRRALSAYDVKIDAVPLLSLATDEVSAFEVLVATGQGSDGLAGPSGLA